jgi:hypothetical protein
MFKNTGDKHATATSNAVAGLRALHKGLAKQTGGEDDAAQAAPA